MYSVQQQRDPLLFLVRLEREPPESFAQRVGASADGGSVDAPGDETARRGCARDPALRAEEHRLAAVVREEELVVVDAVSRRQRRGDDAAVGVGDEDVRRVVLVERAQEAVERVRVALEVLPGGEVVRGGSERARGDARGARDARGGAARGFGGAGRGRRRRPRARDRGRRCPGARRPRARPDAASIARRRRGGDARWRDGVATPPGTTRGPRRRASPSRVARVAECSRRTIPWTRRPGAQQQVKFYSSEQ